MLNYRIAPLTAAIAVFSLSALATDIHQSEVIKLKFKTQQGTEVLEMENFPRNATETVVAESGNQALVTRLDDGSFEIEMAGETFDIGSPGGDMHVSIDELHTDLGELHSELAELHLDVDGMVEPGEHSEHRVIVRHFDDDNLSAEDRQMLEDMDIDLDMDLDIDGGDGEKVVVIRKEIVREVEVH